VIELLGSDSLASWLAYFAIGCLWLGAQIVWVAPLPRQLRRGETPTAPKGSAAAFGLFWIDQYGWIGLSLCGIGLSTIIGGLLLNFAMQP